MTIPVIIKLNICIVERQEDGVAEIKRCEEREK